jgi:hypothetical protein
MNGDYYHLPTCLPQLLIIDQSWLDWQALVGFWTLILGVNSGHHIGGGLAGLGRKVSFNPGLSSGWRPAGLGYPLYISPMQGTLHVLELSTCHFSSTCLLI